MSFENFNFKQPDYVPVFAERIRRLSWLRDPEEGPKRLAFLKKFYADHPADFIHDWGCTVDPRNADINLPVTMPFLLFPRQREWVDWFMERWQSREPGLVEKSREMGMSWLAISVSAALCMFREGITAGFGSRDEDSVDLSGDPDCLFWKARAFMNNLPPEFTGGWNEKRDSAHMRVRFPATGSIMKGDAGDQIGRGGRASWYFVDEAAFLKRPQLVENALSQTTNCRIDISSANGMANPFAQKVMAGKIKSFRFHWRDDPRKDDAWYAKQVDELGELVVAQEIDINYAASAVGVLIPNEWAQAAVGAFEHMGIPKTGTQQGSLDVADEGEDVNAFCRTLGVSIEEVRPWSGKGADIFNTVVEAFAICDEFGLDAFNYDADGLGAGVRGDARVINATRAAEKIRQIRVEPFRGSGKVHKPEAAIPTASTEVRRDQKERKNEDMFLNAKAQGWWETRVRFQRTFRARAAFDRGEPIGYDPDDLINISRDMDPKQRTQLLMELVQPTYEKTTSGKLAVDKTPEGTKSPNLADSVMIRFAPRKRSMFEYL